MSNSQKQKILKQSLVFFYYIHIKSLYNKIKNLSMVQFILFVISLIGGAWIAYWHFFKKIFSTNISVISLAKPEYFERPETFWLSCIAACAYFLNIMSLRISQKDANLISVSSRNLNFYLSYLLIRDFSKFLWICLPAIFYSKIIGGMHAFFYSFSVLFLFRCPVLVIKYYLKFILIRKELLNNRIFKIIWILGIFGLSALFYLFYKTKATYPQIINYLFKPLLAIINTLSTGVSSPIHIEPMVFVFWFFISILLIVILKKKMAGMIIGISFEEIPRVKNKKNKILNYIFVKKCFLKNLSILIIKEVKFLRDLITKKSGLILLIPALLNILFYVYAIYSENRTNPFPQPQYTSLLPVFFMITFASTIVLPFTRNELRFLWIYRINRNIFNRFISTKLFFLYMLHQALLLPVLFVTIFILGIFFNIEIPRYFDLKISILLFLFGPFYPCSVGLYAGLILPKIYFQSNSNQMHLIFAVLFIWFIALVMLPFIALLLLSHNNNLFLAGLLGYTAIFYILYKKMLLKKIMEKEI